MLPVPIYIFLKIFALTFHNGNFSDYNSPMMNECSFIINYFLFGVSDRVFRWEIAKNRYTSSSFLLIMAPLLAIYLYSKKMMGRTGVV